MKCGFHYDERVEESVAVPAIRAIAGEGAEANYRMDSPSIDEKDGSVLLIFYYKSEKALDPPRFELTVNPCSMQVEKAELSTAITPD
jgi:hypothetical protein